MLTGHSKSINITWFGMVFGSKFELGAGLVAR